MKYTIDVRFSTRVERSPRVIEIAEAFGLGLTEKHFVVFDHLELEVNQGDLVYITGQSGGGKSVLLRELSKQMDQQGLQVAHLDTLELDNRPLIEQLGGTTNQALQILGAAGLNDANLFIKKPSELSDGQRYRFRLAKLMLSGAKVWVADEFLAVLDRDTAKSIAFTIQKIARTQGATLMVATTHTDMVSDLAPDLYIEKKYREKVKVEMKNGALIRSEP